MIIEIMGQRVLVSRSGLVRPDSPLLSAVVAAPTGSGGDQFTTGSAPTLPDGETSGSRPARRIAVVADDETPILSLVARILVKHSGFTKGDVLTALNGAAALAVFPEDPADVAVVISDMRMPGGARDGIELYEAVRARAPGVPFIFMSGGMPDATRSELNDILARDPQTRFLDKTLLAVDLTALLDDLL